MSHVGIQPRQVLFQGTGTAETRGPDTAQAGDTKCVRACLAAPCQGDTSNSPWRSGENQTTRNGVYGGLCDEVSEVCQQETMGLGHSYSHCSRLPQNSFSQTSTFIQSLKRLVMATVFDNTLAVWFKPRITLEEMVVSEKLLSLSRLRKSLRPSQPRMQSTRENTFCCIVPRRMLQILTSFPRPVSALAIKWSLGLLPMGKELSAEWKQTQLTRTEIGRAKQCRARVCVGVRTWACREIVTCVGTGMVLLETQSRKEQRCIFEQGLRRDSWLCNANEIKTQV